MLEEPGPADLLRQLEEHQLQDEHDDDDCSERTWPAAWRRLQRFLPDPKIASATSVAASGTPKSATAN
jgi:hypothetical protein